MNKKRNQFTGSLKHIQAVNAFMVCKELCTFFQEMIGQTTEKYSWAWAKIQLCLQPCKLNQASSSVAICALRNRWMLSGISHHNPTAAFWKSLGWFQSTQAAMEAGAFWLSFQTCRPPTNHSASSPFLRHPFKLSQVFQLQTTPQDNSFHSLKASEISCMKFLF